MISTKNLISSINEVPTEWVFEYYLNLEEKLTGQTVQIRSVFNPRERTPSMFLFPGEISTNKYFFKDYSTGNAGSSIKLVMLLNNIPYWKAKLKVIQDYNEYTLDTKYTPLKEFKVHNKYQVDDYEIRHWTNFDQNYWSMYKINSRLLEAYNVSPLTYYTMSKEEDGKRKVIKIEGRNIYGYFKDDGTLYKIYQPKVKKKKFIKVRNYIQGSEQLKYDKEFLIICSSLKDMLAFNKLKITNGECIAPDSENTLIPEAALNKITEKYKDVCVVFDNDEAGIRSMKRYQDKFNFKYVILDLEKDISDAVKKYGIDKTRNTLFKLLKEQLRPNERTIKNTN